MELYDVCKPLGRFVLRVGGESIAGGTVTAVSLFESSYYSVIM